MENINGQHFFIKIGLIFISLAAKFSLWLRANDLMLLKQPEGYVIGKCNIDSELWNMIEKHESEPNFSVLDITTTKG
jgi:hypothetical protein